MINCVICGKEVFNSDQHTLNGKRLCFLCGVNMTRLSSNDEELIKRAKDYYSNFVNNLFDKEIEEVFLNMLSGTIENQSSMVEDKPSLIICPCCKGKVSNMAITCVHCGHPLKNQNDKMSSEHNTTVSTEIQKKTGAVTKQPAQMEKHEFNGIYRVSLFGNKKTEIHCPKCGSEDCEWMVEKVVVPDKVKTKYTANLNPLKPFTLVNKKEKVVSKGYDYDRKRIKCNSCGKVFY